MSDAKPQPLVVNGWTILAHPLLLEQLETLIRQVEQLRQKDAAHYQKKRLTKILAALIKLITETLPQDPERPEYRQGDTLGDEYKHWFRAKFFQQYRLFFRYSTVTKILIFAWVNDEDSLRAYNSKSDAYAVFAKMLNAGNPPDDWAQLRKAAEAEADRLQKALPE
jgi:toxin YhaV